MTPNKPVRPPLTVFLLLRHTSPEAQTSVDHGHRPNVMW